MEHIDIAEQLAGLSRKDVEITTEAIMQHLLRGKVCKECKKELRSNGSSRCQKCSEAYKNGNTE